MKKLVVALVVAFVTFFGYNSLNAQNMKKEEVPQNISAFPIGEENVGFKQYFTGESWLARLTDNKDLNVPMSNVTFEPGCRNNWHSHTGGQILIAVSGVGYYQERGKASRRLLPGDVVEIAPDIEHWHGAAPDSWFSHLAIECNPQTNKNTWLERVSDQQYAEATKDNVATGLVSEEDYKALEDYTMRLFERGTQIAAKRGLILVDTKYEFGKDKNGVITLIDEIHTPDSSRYFYSEGYDERQKNGQPQKQLSKEFVREWLMENGFQGRDGEKVPAMTSEVIDGISARYIELYEHIMGEKFTGEPVDGLEGRILDFIKTL